MNTHPALKIGLPIAIGSFIGTIIALSMQPSFWWIGLISGGCLSYCIYEFKTFISAFPKAWKKTIDWIQSKETHEKAWDNIKYIVLCCVAGLGFTTTICAFFFKFGMEKNIKYSDALAVSKIIYIFITLFFFCTFMPGRKNHQARIMVSESLIDFAKFSNPIGLIYLVIKLLFEIFNFLYIKRMAIQRLCRIKFKLLINALEIPLQSIWKFLSYLFKEIHSEARFICGVDACIGVAIGYHYNSPVIGVIGGVLFGLLNYYVVSIRILKLKPKF